MDLSRFSDETWDRFFDFLAADTENLSIEEVRRELAEAGIDTTDAKRRVREMVELARRRADGAAQ